MLRHVKADLGKLRGSESQSGAVFTNQNYFPEKKSYSILVFIPTIARVY